MTPRPSTVAAELTVPCVDLGSGPDTHLVWIHRNGTVTTPTHQDSPEQQVADVLGDQTWTTCRYWHAASGKHTAMPPVPSGRESWAFTHVDLWTKNAIWTALTGIIGERVTNVTDPVHALSVMQAYLAHGVEPSDPITTVVMLADPRLDGRGWRRSQPATAVEVLSLLQCGVPTNSVPSAISLDVPADIADLVLRQIRKARLPEELLFGLAYAVPPSRLPDLVQGKTPDEMRALAHRVGTLRERFANGDALTEPEVEMFLRGF